MMPNDHVHNIAYDILAEHFMVTENLHPDAKSNLAAAIKIAVEQWLDEEAEEYRNQGGAS
jgi:hypothetical protein